MMNTVALTENMNWVGKIDNREVPFHRLILAKGTIYNAYLLRTEKPTVIYTVDMEFGREFVEYLSELIDPMLIVLFNNGQKANGSTKFHEQS